MGAMGMDQQFPIVVGEVTFNGTIFWYPVQYDTLWMWFRWDILFYFFLIFLNFFVFCFNFIDDVNILQTFTLF